MVTRAAILRNVGGPLSIEKIEIPPLVRGQVLVKILATGLCHSQLNEINGNKGKEYIPHLLGHEAAGVVVDIGAGVTKVKKDAYVIVSWIKGSGLDAAPPQYASSKGKVNAGAVSTFAEHAVVPENRVVSIDAHVKPEVAAAMGCAVLTGAGIINNFDIKPGQSLAVFGIGGVGACAIIKACSTQAKVTACDIVDWKLKWAREEFGIEVMYPSDMKAGEFDFVVESSGAREAMEKAFTATKDNGTVVLAGNLPPGTKISIDPFDLIKGKRISGSFGGGGFLDRDIPPYIHAYLDGSLPLAKLITKKYSFEGINEGLDDLKAGKLIKGIVLF